MFDDRKIFQNPPSVHLLGSFPEINETYGHDGEKSEEIISMEIDRPGTVILMSGENRIDFEVIDFWDRERVNKIIGRNGFAIVNDSFYSRHAFFEEDGKKTFQNIILVVNEKDLLGGYNSYDIYFQGKDADIKWKEKIEIKKNRAPTIGLCNLSTKPEVPFSCRLKDYIFDKDGDNTNLNLRSSSKSWVKFNKSEGIIYGTPALSDLGFTKLNLAVESEGFSQNYNFDINVTEQVDPKIWGSPREYITVGMYYEFIPNAIDSNRDELEFGATNLPPWLILDNKTGKISGTPGKGDIAS